MAGRRGTAAKATTTSQTQLIEFAAQQDFRFRQQNASAESAQTGQGGERYYTTSRQFAERALAANPAQFRILKTDKRLKCLARDRWAGTNYRGRRVLFLLPSAALGNNVCTALFLQAFAERHDPRALGVFCAQSAADIYLGAGVAEVFTLWLPRRALSRWDVVIDLGHLESRRNIEFWPVDMEADLLAAFDLAPSTRFSGEARPLPDTDRLRIGLLPLASSPLRTLPVAATAALIEALAPAGDLVLCLNRFQHQGVLYRQALQDRLPPDVEVIDAFDSIGALLKAIDGFDYAVFADSGPAHMAKLFATPGVAVYTSAPGDVLQGRFRNLVNWTVPFEGPHCRAPCGLAKIRQTSDGRVGCMGSLGCTVDDLPTTPKRQAPAAVERLLLQEQVPCVAALAEAPDDLVRFVQADLTARHSRT